MQLKTPNEVKHISDNLLFIQIYIIYTLIPLALRISKIYL